MAKWRLIFAVFIIVIPYQIILGQYKYPQHALGVQRFDKTIQNLASQTVDSSHGRQFILSYTDSMAAAASTIQSNIQQHPSQADNGNTGIKVSGRPFGIAVNPNTNMIYVASSLPRKIFFIDGNTDRILKNVSIVGEHDNTYFRSGSRVSPTITINPTTNLLFVAYFDSNILYVLDGSDGNVLNRDLVDGIPLVLATDTTSDVYAVILNKISSSIVYRINTFFNTNSSLAIPHDNLITIDVNSVIEGKNPHKVIYAIGNNQNKMYILSPLSNGPLSKVSTIQLNNMTTYSAGSMAVDTHDNKLYLTDYHRNLVYVISGKTYKQLKTIRVGNGPNGIAFNPNTNMIYVANSSSNNISVIDVTTDIVAHIILVDRNPRGIVVNPNTNMIYVANALSGTVSVIDGKTDKIMSGVNFNVNPPNAGTISCNNKGSSNNYAHYDLNTRLECKAIPNPGFDFSSWSGDLSSYSNVTVTSTTLPDNVFGWLLSWKGNLSSNTNNNPTIQLSVPHSGRLIANFVQHSGISIPPEFWAAVSAIITSFFIPSIVGYLKGRMQRGNLRKYLDKIDLKHDKLDLNMIKNEIQELYAEGKISDSHYEVLKDKISEYYK